MDKVYSVLFKDSNKAYNFKSDVSYNINDLVIVDTEKGLQFAKVTRICKTKPTDEMKQIIRLATEEDQNIYMDNLKDAEKALKKCNEFVKELDLDMKVINAQWTFERTQLLFNFIADNRVDFRELAKKLAYVYHTRIELRQIGARDKAKEVGGVGICGDRLCCTRFLKQMDTISINMAKDQNLALNPTKINGACGRLLCCLAYENETYLECSKGMPSVGDIIKTKKGEGQVVSVDILGRKCQILIDGNKEEIYIDENSKK